MWWEVLLGRKSPRGEREREREREGEGEGEGERGRGREGTREGEGASVSRRKRDWLLQGVDELIIAIAKSHRHSQFYLGSDLLIIA